jgi:hypothetical protein
MPRVRAASGDTRTAMTDLGIPSCDMCGRQRTVGTPEHPMDSYDYNASQVVTGQPLGWYSAPDGEICPEDMTRMLRDQ